VNTRIDRETVDEIEFHIEMRTKDYEEQGLSPEAARQKALGHFGRPDAVERRIATARDGSTVRRKLIGAGLTVGGLAALVLVLVLTGVLEQPFYAVTGEYPKVAPYDAVRWDGTTPEVRVDEKWYRLLDVDRVSAESIVSFCRGRWPHIWKKRFEEDLYQAMSRMGRPPSERVDLALVDLATGKDVLLPGVPMTSENRRRIWRAAGGGELR
jgi:hypothetical protein